jgi:hypothetical protein
VREMEKREERRVESSYLAEFSETNAKGDERGVAMSCGQHGTTRRRGEEPLIIRSLWFSSD